MDAIDTAMTAQPTTPRADFFGRVSVDVWYCVLVKGTGKVPFDPAQHTFEDRRTAIRISVTRLASSRARFDVERDMIAESNDWAKITMPSLQALKASLRGIHGRWAHVQMVPSGSYLNNAGEEKTRTTIKFIALYDTEDACEAAASKLFSGAVASPVSARQVAGTTAANPAAASNDRMLAAKFLPALWRASNQDVERFAARLAATKLPNGVTIATLFPIDSPEVIAIIAS